MPRLPSESFCGPRQRFHAIRLDMEGGAMGNFEAAILTVVAGWFWMSMGLVRIFQHMAQEDRNNG